MSIQRWDGVSPLGGGAVVAPDLFGSISNVPAMTRDEVSKSGWTNTKKNIGLREACIAQVFARIAAAPDTRVLLPTEHVERAARWFRWLGCAVGTNPGTGERHFLPTDPLSSVLIQGRRAGLRFVPRPAGEGPVWPLPNLTLLAPPSQLDALLRLPAAAHGVWVRSEEDALLAEHVCLHSVANTGPHRWSDKLGRPVPAGGGVSGQMMATWSRVPVLLLDGCWRQPSAASGGTKPIPGPVWDLKTAAEAAGVDVYVTP